MCYDHLHPRYSRILRTVGSSGVVWRLRAGIPICDHTQQYHYSNPNT
jgi:hypothetical protein